MIKKGPFKGLLGIGTEKIKIITQDLFLQVDNLCLIEQGDIYHLIDLASYLNTQARWWMSIGKSSFKFYLQQ